MEAKSMRKTVTFSTLIMRFGGKRTNLTFKFHFKYLTKQQQ
jgi:hypothetical protein